MHIDRFTAPTIPEAVAKAKQALGPDAVIIQTKTTPLGGLFGSGSRTEAVGREKYSASGNQAAPKL